MEEDKSSIDQQLRESLIDQEVNQTQGSVGVAQASQQVYSTNVNNSGLADSLQDEQEQPSNAQLLREMGDYRYILRGGVQYKYQNELKKAKERFVKNKYDSREYTQEDFVKDQQRENFDAVVNKFLIETNQYQPMLNTKMDDLQLQKVQVKTLEDIVEQREENLLAQVLDRDSIKKEVLLVDRDYDWYHQKDVNTNVVNINLKSNGKVKWKGQEQGFWYKLDEEEFIFQVNNVCHRMKYQQEEDIWNLIWPERSPKSVMKLNQGTQKKKKNKQIEPGEEESEKNHKIITELSSGDFGMGRSLKNAESRMMKCKIDYLPLESIIQKDGIVTNCIVKRIFVSFKLYLQIWKNVINTKNPEESTTKMLHESHVNDVPGIETDPNFIWMQYLDGKLVWYSIENNWLDDTTEIYANRATLETYNHIKFNVEKKLLKTLEFRVQQGRLHSIHGFQPYVDHIWTSPKQESNIKYIQKKEIILIFENNWVEIFEPRVELARNFENFKIGDSFSIVDIREDLKFIFSEPPILIYEQWSKSHVCYLNLGNQSEVICSQLINDGEEKIFIGLEKYLKKSSNHEAEYKRILKAFDKRATHHKNQQTTYQEFVYKNIATESLVKDIQYISAVCTQLEQYKTVKYMVKNLSERFNEISDQNINQGVSIFFCYVGRPYLQVITRDEEDDDQVKHRLLHFDITPMVKNQVEGPEFFNQNQEVSTSLDSFVVEEIKTRGINIDLMSARLEDEKLRDNNFTFQNDELKYSESGIDSKENLESKLILTMLNSEQKNQELLKDFGVFSMPIVFASNLHETKTIRFVIFDMESMDILKQFKIENTVDLINKKEFDDSLKISFCQSTERVKCRDENNDQVIETRYQILISNLQMAVIHEVSLIMKQK